MTGGFAVAALAAVAVAIAGPAAFADESTEKVPPKLGQTNTLWESTDCTKHGLQNARDANGQYPLVCDGWIPVWTWDATAQTWSKSYVERHSIAWLDECGFADEWSWATFNPSNGTTAYPKTETDSGMCTTKDAAGTVVPSRDAAGNIVYRKYKPAGPYIAVHDSYLYPKAGLAIGEYKSAATS